MTVDLNTLEVGDTIELRDWSKHVVTELKSSSGLWWVTTKLLRNCGNLGSLCRTNHYANGRISQKTVYPGDIVVIHKKDEPIPVEIEGLPYPPNNKKEKPMAVDLSTLEFGDMVKTQDGNLLVVTECSPLNDGTHSLAFVDEKGSLFQKVLNLNHEYFDIVAIYKNGKPKRKVKRTVEVVRWMNAYKDGQHPREVFYTKVGADNCAEVDRIACVELRGSYEIEEEVEE